MRKSNIENKRDATRVDGFVDFAIAVGVVVYGVVVVVVVVGSGGVDA